MKRKRTLYLSSRLLIALMSIGIANSNAQNKTPPVPATLNEINYKKPGNALQSLEKSKAAMRTKAKALGFGGAATDYEMDGDKSPVRLAAADGMTFIVSLGDGMGDPSAWFILFKAKTKKGKRIGNYINSKTIIGTKTSEGESIIAYTVKKLGNQVYEIIPSTKLEAGEYFFINKGTAVNHGGTGVDAFAFGID